jgi:hypothetical protein
MMRRVPMNWFGYLRAVSLGMVAFGAVVLLVPPVSMGAFGLMVYGDRELPGRLLRARPRRTSARPRGDGAPSWSAGS